ncbi:cysteine hydrolase family protein [Desulforhopalus sp. 52FAK]
MEKALLIIDIQNDYFENGSYPLWNSEETLNRIESAIKSAQDNQIAVILIQHIADKAKGIAPFFNSGTDGVNIHNTILEAVPDAPVIIKTYADSFHETTLEETLKNIGVQELLVCGMMTQNCVTHTAISKSAGKYKVSILQDCCTTVDEMIHLIALNAVSTRVSLLNSTDLGVIAL